MSSRVRRRKKKYIRTCRTSLVWTVPHDDTSTAVCITTVRTDLARRADAVTSAGDDSITSTKNNANIIVETPEAIDYIDAREVRTAPSALDSMPTDQSRDGEVRSTKSIIDLLLPEFLRDGFAGAASGAVARWLTAPLDVAKIRFQLDHGATPRYGSLLETMCSIYAEEGLVSLWRGNVPAIYLWATFGGVQFGMYEHLQRVDFLRANAVSRTQDRCRAHEMYREGRESDGRGGPARGAYDEDEDRTSGGLPTAASNFVYGAVAGCAATVASYPFDITRTALAFQGVPKRYTGITAFLTHTVREAGPRGLYRGIFPAIAMIAPQVGVGFTVYEVVKGNPPTWLMEDPSRGSRSAPVESTARTRGGGADSDTEGTDNIGRLGGRKTKGSIRRAGSDMRGERQSRLEKMWPLVAGATAGMTSKLVVFPLDTIKKRMQAQVMLQRDVSYGILPKYAGSMDALRTIFRQEGPLALFRGSMPAILKSGLSTGLTFVVFEWFRAMKTD